MNEPIQVQITKIKISKDKKTGNKIASIQLTRIVGESDEYDGDLAKAINQMVDNPHVEVMRLSYVKYSQSLTFSCPGLSRGSDLVPSSTLEKFKLERLDSKAEGAHLSLSFEFVVSLKDAKRWLIPSIGDDVNVLIEDAQGSLPALGAGDHASARPN